MNKTWLLLDGDTIYAAMFDEDMAHEVALDYDLDIEEVLEEEVFN